MIFSRENKLPDVFTHLSLAPPHGAGARLALGRVLGRPRQGRGQRQRLEAAADALVAAEHEELEAVDLDRGLGEGDQGVAAAGSCLLLLQDPDPGPGGGDEGGGGSGPGHCGPRLHNSLLGLHIGRRFGQLLWPGIGCFISTGDLNT